MPSPKYSLSGSELMLVNGSTAMDFSVGASRWAGLPGSGAINAAANCAAVAYRSVRSRASALATARLPQTGTPARTLDTSDGRWVKRIAMTAWAVAAVNGGAPAHISYSTQPKL